MLVLQEFCPTLMPNFPVLNQWGSLETASYIPIMATIRKWLGQFNFYNFAFLVWMKESLDLLQRGNPSLPYNYNPCETRC